MQIFFIGLKKTIVGTLSFNPDLFADGFFNILIGAIELVTAPLTWFLKPTTRGIATLINGGYKKIEENKGLQDLAKYGRDYLTKTDVKKFGADKTMYELLFVCNDIHRKFEKSITRGQATELEGEEYESYSAIRITDINTILDRQKLIHYFSLFSPSEKQESKSGSHIVESKTS